MDNKTVVSRLEEVRELLLMDNIPGVDTFDMECFGTAEESLGGEPCGTACCLGGAMSLQDVWRGRGMGGVWWKVKNLSGGHEWRLACKDADGRWTHFGLAAANAVGITELEADDLFLTLCYRGDTAVVATREDVLGRVDSLIQKYAA